MREEAREAKAKTKRAADRAEKKAERALGNESAHTGCERGRREIARSLAAEARIARQRFGHALGGFSASALAVERVVPNTS